SQLKESAWNQALYPRTHLTQVLDGQLTRQVLLVNLVWGTGVQHLPGGLSHLQPVPCAHQLPLAQCGPLAIHASGSTCKPAYKYPVTLHLHFVIASLRQYSMILQTLHSFLGILTLICRRRRYYLLTPGQCPAAQCLQWAESLCGAVTLASPSYAAHNNQDCLGLLHRDDHVKGPWRAQGPGPLERCLHAKSSEDISNMKFQPSCMSSYWKRHHRHIQLPQGFPPMEVLKGTLVVSQRNSQLEKDADATTGQKRHWKNAHPHLTVPGPKSARFFCCHTALSMNPQLERCGKMQESPGPIAVLESAGV
ncbi:hypothetical protein EI555_016732, partial [Monodon monoceros]